MGLRIEIWGPPLGPLTGGNLYDRILAETLRTLGHQVTVREFTGSDPEPSEGGEPADVVLQDELLHREFLPRNREWKAPRPRIVALVHHPMSSEPERGPAELRRLREEERTYLRSVDGILSPSQASVEAARKLAGRKLPAAVVAPGRDRLAGGALSALPSPEEIRTRARGPLRAAFAGNVIPRKRLLELLDGLATVPEWTLSVAGREDPDPDYAARVRQRASASDLSGRVTFRGALGPAELAGLLRGCTLLAVPSTHEGFGIVYLEGFAFGLPALAAASGGAPEFVSEGETGWLLRPSETEGVAERIAGHLKLLASDRQRLAAMGVRAAERHRSHPTWKASVAAAEPFLRLRES